MRKIALLSLACGVACFLCSVETAILKGNTALKWLTKDWLKFDQSDDILRIFSSVFARI